VTSSAEFNFYQDPEAAKVALFELNCRKTMVTWELFLQYALPWVGIVTAFKTSSIMTKIRRRDN